MAEPVTTGLTIGVIIKHGMLAIFGAMVHAISAHRTGKSKGFADFVLLTIMSSFSGIIFGLIALQFLDNEYLTLAATGSGGWLGVEGLTILAAKIRTQLADFLSK